MTTDSEPTYLFELPSYTRIGIIGLGRLGGSLRRALEAADIEVEVGELARDCPIVFLCVPDDVISTVAANMADFIAPGTTIAHCSGALSSNALAALEEEGCSVGSFHPLQTFPDPEVGATRFAGCTIFIEGDKVAVRYLHAVAHALGAHPQPISAEGKTGYHAAAAMACNQLCALLDAAFEVAGAAGVADPAVFLPLVRATLDGIEQRGTHAALTGPVMRGDAATVAGHLALLDESNPQAAAIYRVLSRRALAMAGESGTMAEDARLAVSSVLGEKEELL